MTLRTLLSHPWVLRVSNPPPPPCLTAIDSERRNAKLEEAQSTIRVLLDVLQEVAPEMLTSMPIPRSAISFPSREELVVLPEADASQRPALKEREAAVLGVMSARPWPSLGVGCCSTSGGSMRAFPHREL